MPRFDVLMMRFTAQRLLDNKAHLEEFLRSESIDHDDEQVENVIEFLRWVCDHELEYALDYNEI